MLFLLIAMSIALIMVSIPFFIAQYHPTLPKLSPYECGFETFDSSHRTFDIRFYLTAILFIVFDLEIAFLFPWALKLKTMSTMAFSSMLIFLIMLTIGFIYELKRGALEWD